MLAHIPVAELAAALDAVAEEVLEQAHVTVPPVDAFRLARALDIVVATDAQQTCRARYVRLRPRGGWPQPAILLRPDPRAERLHWAAAHELGEHLAVRLYERLGLDPRIDGAGARESLANHLARRLLLPTRWFSADGIRLQWDLAALKARYTTASHELIARRMLEFEPPTIVSIFDQSRLYFRRANLGRQFPALCSDELRCWQQVHRRASPGQLRTGGLWIRGWPIHEPHWKREILRTEPAGDEQFRCW